ncbi:GAF domain-containing sensor histidine kinase [Mesoflavibacter sp. SCSIO 43206]|uniref:GAF domain-containing sensor histidine kinase n=1 Tax=Mesoflavibacter sp. SCSIO 43206 TaxID=2779362 RepID=UPI001CA87501|nr:GAF domain-containing sensor histidine kinase [Mesoflavibacter sp. SCSIO 43206]UAB75221.1 GAF domain-containing sensor histidine kinase [Mesoflavibacter sp. SCSIO 43206]
MIAPKLPKNEKKRLKAVKEYKLLDTLPEEDFDNITNLVANICDVPISLISLLDADRNFLKSHYGIPFNESPRNISFCGHAILENNSIFIVEDATKDQRFYNNPLIKDHNVKFYAGVPLINPEGFPLGTLCVYDVKPKKLTKQQQEAMIILAKQVVNLFELRLKNNQLTNAYYLLDERHQSLKTFAGKVSHDLKSPLANITSLSQLFKDELKASNPEINLEYLDFIEESADTLRAYIDGILKHYKSEALLQDKKQTIDLSNIFNDVKQMLSLKDTQFKLKNNPNLGDINKSAITQIILNLVDNAVKYNTNNNPLVVLDYKENETHHHFSVSDNGNGIPESKKESLFDLFNTAHDADKYGNKGTGIGLYTVKTLVEKLGGEVSLTSKVNEGTTFSFSVEK